MIKFKKISSGTHWSGSDLTIVDEDELARLVAHVALGQYLHVLAILNGTGSSAYAPAGTAREGAVKLLTAKDPDNPWHRDGWLFQVISWIAAQIQDPSSIKSPPHIRIADKGFDGLHLRLKKNKKEIDAIVICEEKATNSPRPTIRDKVWPEFRDLEKGERDNELVAETSALMQQNPAIDPTNGVQAALWNGSRSYRVSITVGDKENSAAGRRKLFKGYRKTVPTGGVQKRRAETLYNSDLRAWLSALAEKAVAAIEEMDSEDV